VRASASATDQRWMIDKRWQTTSMHRKRPVLSASIWSHEHQTMGGLFARRTR